MTIETLKFNLSETEKHLMLSSQEIAKLRAEVDNWRRAAEHTTEKLTRLQAKFQVQSAMIDRLIYALKEPLDDKQMRFKGDE